MADCFPLFVFFISCSYRGIWLDIELIFYRYLDNNMVGVCFRMFDSRGVVFLLCVVIVSAWG